MLKQILRKLIAAKPVRPNVPMGAGTVRPSVEQLLEAASRHASAGSLESAAGACTDALALNESNAYAHHLLGMVRAQQGSLPQALRHFERAHALSPHDADILVDYGNLYCLLGDDAQALDYFSRASTLAPKHPLAALGRARLLEQAGRVEEASDTLHAALTADFEPALVRRLVTLLDRTGREGEARRLCESVLRQHPEHAEAHSGLGFMALKHDLDADGAARHLQCAAQVIDDDPALWSNLGIALQELGELDRALASYDRALSIQPDHAPTLVHRALARLLQVDYARGLPEYEHRRLAEDWVAPPFVLPQWAGEDVSQRTLLVHTEQGIGDEILFASCLPDLIARARSVVVECSPKLVPIFARSFPGTRVVSMAARDKQSVEPVQHGADLMTAAGSLPLQLQRAPGRFPLQASWLAAAPELVAEERTRLAALGGGLKVGLSWQGGTHKTWGAVRSIPLMALLPVLRVPGVQFIDMQYADSGAQLRELQLRHGVAVHHFADALADYERTAALVCALDLLITIDTAIAQLAGALGRPVWTMVTVSPDWRYGLRGATTPWYASMQVFRQARYREWGPVIEQVAMALARRAAIATPTEQH